jgi:hypothetical protein
MTLDIKNNPPTDPRNVTGNKDIHDPSTSGPAKKFPGEHDDSSTVKNPKTPETSGKTDVDRIANRAAHKPARDQQESDQSSSIFTH